MSIFLRVNRTSGSSCTFLTCILVAVIKVEILFSWQLLPKCLRAVIDILVDFDSPRLINFIASHFEVYFGDNVT